MMLRPRHPLQFLVALVSACLLWWVLAGQRSENISVRGVKARLTLVNIPRDLILISSVPDLISLQLRGPLNRALASANPPEVLLDLADARPGLNSFPINERDITLPAEVEVVSIDPPTITLELERQETRVLPVRPTIEGAPAPGFEVLGVRVVPSQYTVQGPESQLLALEWIGTGPVSIEGAAEPVETVVQPVLPDPQVRALGLSSVQVIIDIGPETGADGGPADRS